MSMELWHGIELFEGINQQCLLPVGQELQIDAQAFFLLFHWLSSRGCVQAGDAGYRVVAIRVVAPAPVLAVSCCCASLMLVPHGRVARYFQLYNVGLHTPNF
jgi:hypothetical protein